MSRTTRVVFPRTQERLVALGARLRAARLRRRIPQTEMAVRVGVSRTTIFRLEQGDPRVNLAVLARALTVLGLDGDLDRVVERDEIGERLQDLELPQRPHRTIRPAR